MPLVASIPISGSLFETHLYRVEYNPEEGTVSVYIDGELELSSGGLYNPPDFNYYAFRALDMTEFSDLEISPLNADNTPPEVSHE